VRLQGFIVSDQLARWPEIIRELAGRVAAASSSTARTSPKGWRTRRRRSSACSRARTSASSW
jgi:hypothetical protein